MKKLSSARVKTSPSSSGNLQKSAVKVLAPILKRGRAVQEREVASKVRITETRMVSDEHNCQ